MRGWNMYISLYIFTGRNLITHLTLFFFPNKIPNTFVQCLQSKSTGPAGLHLRPGTALSGEVSSRCLHIPYF